MFTLKLGERIFNIIVPKLVPNHGISLPEQKDSALEYSARLPLCFSDVKIQQASSLATLERMGILFLLLKTSLYHLLTTILRSKCQVIARLYSLCDLVHPFPELHIELRVNHRILHARSHDKVDRAASDQ